MNIYLALKQQHQDLMAEARALDSLTDEGAARLSALMDEIDAVDKKILLQERLREAERAATPLPQVSSVHDRAEDKPWGIDTGCPFGEFLQAVHHSQTGRITDPRLLYQSAAQGAGETVGSDGGFLVPKEMAEDILVRATDGEIWSRVRRRTLTVANEIELNVVDETSRATGSRSGAVQAYWVDEGTAATASRPKFARLSWKPRKIAALGYASDELLADASLIQTVMFEAFVEEIRFQVEDAIVNGTGVGQPQGILNANCLVTVSKETGQAAATIVSENISKMWARMHAPSRSSAVWLINQDIEPQLDQLVINVGTGGVPVYLPAGGFSSGPFGRLKGVPVIPIEYAATLGTLGDLILADLSQYWVFDKGQPRRASSMHVAFTTDEQAFRVTYRVDGRARWKSALTPYKGTGNTQSPFVALAARA